MARGRQAGYVPSFPGDPERVRAAAQALLDALVERDAGRGLYGRRGDVVDRLRRAIAPTASHMAEVLPDVTRSREIPAELHPLALALHHAMFPPTASGNHRS
jgi:hypothetical protein